MRPPPTILVIEHDQALHKLFVEILTEAGYHVLAAYDGVAGLAQLARHGVDIILCDLTMPRLNGIEFCSRLERHAGYQHIPIILTSISSAPPAKVRHFSAFLPKPFHVDQFLALVESLLPPSA